MAARLGYVLYWAGCVLAVVFGGFGIAAYYNAPDSDRWPLVIVLGGIAVIVWLIGRACRFILAGD